MALFEKKRELSRGSPKYKIPQKEEKKDASGFGGKPYLREGEFMRWLREDKLYKTTGIPEAKRIEMGKELFKRQKGYFFEKGEPERILKELKREKFKVKKDSERAEINKKIKLLKEFLGN